MLRYANSLTSFATSSAESDRWRPVTSRVGWAGPVPPPVDLAPRSPPSSARRWSCRRDGWRMGSAAGGAGDVLELRRRGLVAIAVGSTSRCCHRSCCTRRRERSPACRSRPRFRCGPMVTGFSGRAEWCRASGCSTGTVSIAAGESLLWRVSAPPSWEIGSRLQRTSLRTTALEPGPTLALAFDVRSLGLKAIAHRQFACGPAVGRTAITRALDPLLE